MSSLCRRLGHRVGIDTIDYNIIGNPDPKNLAPVQLVMPDFADSPGGFGAGESTSNATFYLVVMEEYVTGAVSPHSQLRYSDANLPHSV